MDSKTDTMSPQDAQRRFDLFSPSTGGLDSFQAYKAVSGTSPAFQQNPVEETWRADIVRRVHTLEEESRKTHRVNVGFVKINLLPNKNLKAPLDAIVEPDEDGFIARATDLPLYGYGDDPINAIEALKREIETLYDDLVEDDQFTDEWLKIKEFLQERIVVAD